MSKEKAKKVETKDITEIQFTKETKKAIRSIILSKQRIKLDEEAVKDDIEGLSAKLGVKPGEINSIVRLIMEEEERGGVLEKVEKRLDFAKQVLDEFEDELPKKEDTPPPAKAV